MQNLQKKFRNINTCENIVLQSEKLFKKIDVEQQKSKKYKDQIFQNLEILNKLKVQNNEKKKQLEEYMKKIQKLKKKHEMIPLIQQLKEHFRELKEQLGSGSLYEDDDVDVDQMNYQQLLQLGQKIGKVSKGVNQQKFNKLERVINTQTQQCSICQQELQMGVECIRLQCSHLFDVQCIKEWLKRQKVCPLCKQEI